MAARALTDPVATPFAPRAVEVLAAALPSQGMNPIGLLARSALVGHAKRLTPGHCSQLAGTGPAFREVFFPKAAPGPYEGSITPLTGLDDEVFAATATALLCRQMADVTSRLRPQLLAQKADADLLAFSTRIRENSYRFYAELAKYADSPIRPALAAFSDEPRRAQARQHYMAGLSSPAWVNAKMVQWSTGFWPDREWELFHHFIKLTALGCSIAEIDTMIAGVVSQGLPVPPEMRPGVWHRQAPWFGNLNGGDAGEATAAILRTNCHTYPGGLRPECIAEDDSYEFTARSQPGNGYRQAPSSSCFAPGTRVVMADGSLRAIEDVAVGDEVATPRGPRAVVLRQRPSRDGRVLERFAGAGFAFAASHPFLTSGGGDAAYAAADPEGLARTVPTLGQFGIRPLQGAELLRRTADGGVERCPAPTVQRAPEIGPEHLYDLFLAVGADGRSEYYAGDEQVQYLVSSKVPRFAAAPETTAVVLHVVEQSGPAVLEALATVPDESFADLLCVGLDSMARTLMPAIGQRLTAPETTRACLPSHQDPDDLAAAVRGFATMLASVPEGYDRRTGVLVEQLAARFAPQFQAALTLPWRTFELADAEVTDMLALTLYSVELFRPGPPANGAMAELVLRNGDARIARSLPVRPAAHADRWYYSVDDVAYFPEWSEPVADGSLWCVEIAIDLSGTVMRLPLPRTVSHGFQAFAAPVRATDGTVVGQAQFDIRLLTLEAYVSEVARRRNPAAGFPERLAHLAATHITHRFAPAVSTLRHCAATTMNP